MYNPVLFIQANIDRFPELDGILTTLPKDVDKQLRVVNPFFHERTVAREVEF